MKLLRHKLKGKFYLLWDFARAFLAFSLIILENKQHLENTMQPALNIIDPESKWFVSAMSFFHKWYSKLHNLDKVIASYLLYKLQ